MKRVIQKLFTRGLHLPLLLILLFTQTVYAVDGDLDLNFAPDVNGLVTAMALQPDGKIVMVGQFSVVDGVQSSGIIRLMADGTVDTDFAFVFVVGTGATVHDVAVQTDGKILFVGDFSSVNGMDRNGIARLHVNGSLDMDFNPNVTPSVFGGVNFNLRTLALQDDGRILIGGFLTAVGGVERSGLARLNTNGSLDTEFNASATGSVATIVIAPDNKIVIGGTFSFVNGTRASGITRLNMNGSLDSDFRNPVLNTSDIRALAVQANGKIMFGGFFSSIEGVERDSLARLNSNGSFDLSFAPVTIESADGSNNIEAIETQTDGKVLVGGVFGDFNGVPMTANLVRFNPDGSLDSSFTPNVARGVFTIAVQELLDDNILIGGFFSSVDGVERSSIARLENNIVAEIGFAGVTNRFEGDVGETVFEFNVLRTLSVAGAASVEYMRSIGAGNSATIDDFASGMFARGSIDFVAGESSKSISIVIAGDTEIEPNETFTMTLSNPVNAILDRAVARGVIIDDDAPDEDLCLPIRAQNGNIAIVCL